MKALLTSCLLLLAPSLPAQKPAPPNILFAIAEDWGRHAGAYGTRWVKTPAFDRVAALRQRMEAMLKAQGDPRRDGRGEIFDHYTPTSGDGFYEKFMRGETVSAG